MTSAQLILVSVSSALIAVIAMLIVATALRVRTRDGGSKDTAPTKAQQTRAQKTAARAQKRAERATTRAQRAAQKAETSASKSNNKEKKVEEKKNESTATPPLETEAKKGDGPEDQPVGDPSAGGEPKAAGPPSQEPSDRSDRSGSDDAGPTTEAGRRAAAAHGAPSDKTGEMPPAGKDGRKKN